MEFCGGLVGYPQGDSIVFADAVAIGVEYAFFVQQALGPLDVLGQARIVGVRDIGLWAGDQVAGGLSGEAVEFLR